MKDNTANESCAGRSNRKIILYILFIGCAVAAFLLSGCKKEEKNNPASRPTPSIEVAEPVVMDVEATESYPANFESADQADVVARANGQILSKHFSDGQYVTKGQLLFVLESGEYENSTRQAQAELASARGNLEYANHHLAALRKAYSSNAVSQMEVAQAVSQQEAAAASVASAEAQLKNANLHTGYCRITAPVSGRISAPLLDVGSYVNGEASPVTLATIYNTGNMLVTFTIPDYRYAEITASGNGFRSDIYRNVDVKISSADDSDAATIYSIDISYEAPVVDESTGNIKLKGRLRSGADKVRPGMYGLVLLPTASIKNGVLVRDASISTDQRGKYLYTLNKNDEIVYTPITIGELYGDTLRLVKSGLKPGQRYVTDAVLTVRAGEKVKPLPAGSKSKSK